MSSFSAKRGAKECIRRSNSASGGADAQVMREVTCANTAVVTRSAVPNSTVLDFGRGGIGLQAPAAPLGII